MKWNTFPVRVVETRDLGPGTRHLALEREDGEPMEYTAGQFINIHFPDPDAEPVEHEEDLIHRSYSVGNPPDGNRMEIAVGYVEGGRASRLLFGAGEGDRLQVSGPYGRFVLKDEEPPARYLLIATGTGVTPYRSMLPELRQRMEAHPDLEIELMLGVRTRDELLYGEEFRAFESDHARFRFRACYSRESVDVLHDSEYAGYVQHHFQVLAPDPERDIVYLCGNPAMIDEAVAILKEKGFPLPRVRREKYLSAR